MYYYPGHRIQAQFCTQSALPPLPGEHSGQSPFYRRTQCQLNHNNVRILPGTHLYTWVESSNVDKVPCWRTKVPGIDGNRTRNPLIQSQGFNPIYHGTSTTEGIVPSVLQLSSPGVPLYFRYMKIIHTIKTIHTSLGYKQWKTNYEIKWQDTARYPRCQI